MKKNNILKIIPTKKLKRKVYNKIRFSSTLNEKFLEPLNKYKDETDNFIEPLLYCDKKIAININQPIANKEEIMKIISFFPYRFDLYIKEKINLKSILYLDKSYQQNIFSNFNNIKQYDYIINIENINDLYEIKNGFFESMFSLFSYNKLSYLELTNKKEKIDINKKEIIKQYINSNLNNITYFEDLLMNNANIALSYIIKTEDISNDTIKLLLNIESVDIAKEILAKILYLTNDIYSYNEKLNRISKFYVSRLSYYKNNYQDLKNKASEYETITFDIFDTLVARKILKPDDLFLIMEQQSKIKFTKPYLKIRKDAEHSALKKKKTSDVTLDEIYQELQLEQKLSKKDTEYLKKLEFDLELELIIPRKDMVELYNSLIKEGKKVDIISDMYLDSKYIKKILAKNNIKNYRNLYISADLNKRKATGEMWDYYFKDNKEKTLHIGDNIHSDYYQVLYHNHDAVKVLNSVDYLNNYNIINSTDNVDNSRLFGYLYNEFLFNSPFFNKTTKLTDLNTYGKYFMAPIIYYFFSWYNKVNTADKILFISREGYYLQKIYKDFIQKFNLQELKNVYFLTSRRAATIAACYNKSDLIELLELEYNGEIKDLFINRYGFNIPEEENIKISLSQDKEKIIPLIYKYEKELLEIAAEERQNYLNYINKTIPNYKKEKLAIIDLGYSGTTQYYLSKLLGIKIEGYYFAITKNLRPKKLDCKVLGYFNTDNEAYTDLESYFYKKSLLLESFLTAPYGQVINFTKDGQANYTQSDFNKKKCKYLDEICHGVTDGLTSIKNNGILPTSNLDKNMIIKYYEYIYTLVANFSGDLSNIFYINDDYCTNGKNIINLQPTKQDQN